MVSITYHGADCCGARHIHNFRDGDDENINGLIRALNNREYRGHLGFDGAPEVPANGNLLLEVILSNRQTERYPRLMAELARLGFVYDASWVGQHGTPVHRFSRARKRLRLADNGFRWAGMMMGPNVGGNLPAFEEQGNNNNNNNNLVVGQRVRYTGPAAHLQGRVGEVVAVNQRRVLEYNYVYDGVRVRWDENGGALAGIIAASSFTPMMEWRRILRTDRNLPIVYGTTRLRVAHDPVGFRGGVPVGEIVTVVTVPEIRQERVTGNCYFTARRENGQELPLYLWNCEIEAPVEEQRREAAEPVQYRHPQLHREGEEPAAPVEAPITVRHTEWFAVFADGRERGPFDHQARLREAYPRVRRMVRRDIMSNGDIRRHDPVNVR